MSLHKNYLIKIFKSATVLSVADAVPTVFLTLFSIAIGRWLGPHIFGLYSIGIIISFLLRTLSDAGYDIKIPRELGSNSKTISELINEAQYIKIRLWSFFFIPIFIIGMTITDSYEYAIMLIWALPCITGNTFRSVLRGTGRMNTIALVESSNNFIMTILLFAVLIFYPRLYLVFIIFLVFEIIKTVNYFIVVNSQSSFASGWWRVVSGWLQSGNESVTRNGISSIKSIIKTQFNLASLTILSVVQIRIPAIALGWFSSIGSVGIFTASQRFITVLRILSGALFNSLLPDFASSTDAHACDGKLNIESEKFQVDNYKIKNKLKLMLLSACVVGALISSILFFLAEPLIMLTFAFSDAIIVLRIISFSFIFIIMNNVMEAYLLSIHRERLINISLIFSIIFILISSLITAPNFGATACAFAVLLADILLFIFYTVVTWQSLNVNSEK